MVVQCTLQGCPECTLFKRTRSSKLLQSSFTTAPPQSTRDWFWTRLVVARQANPQSGTRCSSLCVRTVPCAITRCMNLSRPTRTYLTGRLPLCSFQDLVAAVQLLGAQSVGRHIPHVA